MELTLIITVIAIVLILSNIYKDITLQKVIKQHQEERNDLLNRIMAKNVVEYKQINDSSLPKGNNPIRKKLEKDIDDFEGLYG